MSIITVKHCDCCGKRMQEDHAKLAMPSRLEPARGVPSMLISPWNGDVNQAQQAYAAGGGMLVVRVYDLCEECVGGITTGFAGVGEQVKTAINDDERRRVANRLRNVFGIPG